MIKTVPGAGTKAGVPRCFGFQLLGTSGLMFPVTLRDLSGSLQTDLVVVDGSWLTFGGEEVGPFIIDPDNILAAPGGAGAGWTIVYGTESGDEASSSGAIAQPTITFAESQVVSAAGVAFGTTPLVLDVKPPGWARRGDIWCGCGTLATGLGGTIVIFDGFGKATAAVPIPVPATATYKRIVGLGQDFYGAGGTALQTDVSQAQAGVLMARYVVTLNGGSLAAGQVAWLTARWGP